MLSCGLELSLPALVSVEFGVLVRLECVGDLVDCFIVAGNLGSFYVLVRTCGK